MNKYAWLTLLLDFHVTKRYRTKHNIQRPIALASVAACSPLPESAKCSRPECELHPTVCSTFPSPCVCYQHGYVQYGIHVGQRDERTTVDRELIMYCSAEFTPHVAIHTDSVLFNTSTSLLAMKAIIASSSERGV